MAIFLLFNIKNAPKIWYISINLLIYIDFIYRIDHLFCIVSSLNKRIPPLSTNRYNKFINFQSTFYCFKFETIYPQEFAKHVKIMIEWQNYYFFWYKRHRFKKMNKSTQCTWNLESIEITHRQYKTQSKQNNMKTVNLD